MATASHSDDALRVSAEGSSQTQTPPAGEETGLRGAMSFARTHSGFGDDATRKRVTLESGTSSRRSRKKSLLNTARTLRHLTGLAKSLTMEDDDIRSNLADSSCAGSNAANSPDSLSETGPSETGKEVLQRAMTAEVKQRNLSNHATVLGHTSNIDPEHLMRVALEEEWQMVSCASWPFTITFFAIFMLFFQRHYCVTDIFLVEDSLRRGFGVHAEAISEAVGIYGWLEHSYLPYLWAATPNIDVASVSGLSFYHQLVGGTRLTMTSGAPAPCEHSDLVGDIWCYTDISEAVSSIGGDAFARRLSERSVGPSSTDDALEEHTSAEASGFLRRSGRLQVPGIARVLHRATLGAHSSRALDHPSAHPRDLLLDRRGEEQANGAESREQQEVTTQKRQLRLKRPEIIGMVPNPAEGRRSEVILPRSVPLEQVLHNVSEWRSAGVISETTLTFGAETLFLNEHAGIDVLTIASVEFSIHRGGQVFTRVVISSFILSSVWNDPLQGALGVVWLLCLTSFTAVLLVRLYMRWLHNKCCQYLLRLWNLMEWGIILSSWGVLVLFTVERLRVGDLLEELEAYKSSRSRLSEAELHAADSNAVRGLLSVVESISELSGWVQLSVSMYHIVLVFRFFLASRGQPRLAVVLTTIRQAGGDLLHLLIVFLIIIIAFSVSGHILFGRRIAEFATFTGAFAQCVQIVMEREYTWDRFTEEDQWTSTLWVWSFLLLVVLVLVNIFLAMVFDTYGDVRASVGQSATLWQTTQVVLRHLHGMSSGKGHLNSSWLPNRDVVQAVKTLQARAVSPGMVVEALPGVSAKQVNYLFNIARAKLENSLLRRSKVTQLPLVASVLLGVVRMNHCLSRMDVRPTLEEAPALKPSTATTQPATAPALDCDGHHVDSSNAVAEPSLSSDAPSQPTPAGGAKRAASPPWLKVQLLPHIQKQQSLLMQVHVQIQRLSREIDAHGLGDDLPPPPTVAPPGLQDPTVLGLPRSRLLLPRGPSTSTSIAGQLRRPASRWRPLAPTTDQAEQQAD